MAKKIEDFKPTIGVVEGGTPVLYFREDTVEKLRKMIERLCKEFDEVNWQGAPELREEASALLRETR